jgi:hypothetical protein
MLRLRKQLIAVEEERMAGEKGFSVDEVDEMFQVKIIG